MNGHILNLDGEFFFFGNTHGVETLQDGWSNGIIRTGYVEAGIRPWEWLKF